MNLGTFSIKSLIVHDVPLRRVGAEDNQAPVLSEVPSELDPVVRNLFGERFKRSLARNHYDVERDPVSTSPVPDLALSIFSSTMKDADTTLVSASQEMARHLYSTQTGSNTPALLIVCRAEVDNGAAVAIMKLEREDAVHLSQINPMGQRTFGIEYLRDLMLGKNTRVFKAALFNLPGGILDGLVSDEQKGDPNAEVANFFLHSFLGCKLKTAPEVATKVFFTATQDYINTLDDPEKQARYEIALIAAMNTPAPTMTAGSVANQLDITDRQPYRSYLVEREAPTGRFDKDTRLVAAQLRQVVFGFKTSRLRLSGPPGDIKEYVRFNEEGDAAPVEIHDQVKDVRGGSH